MDLIQSDAAHVTSDGDLREMGLNILSVGHARLIAYFSITSLYSRPIMYVFIVPFALVPSVRRGF